MQIFSNGKRRFSSFIEFYLIYSKKLSLVIFSKLVLSQGKENKRRLQTLQIDDAWSKKRNCISLAFRMLNQYFFAT